jgi:hypothetical protein
MPTTPENMLTAKRIVAAIWHDVNDRRGIKAAIAETPELIQQNIQDSWAKDILAILTQAGTTDGEPSINKLGLVRVEQYKEGDHILIHLQCPCCCIRQEFVGEYGKHLYGPDMPRQVIAYCTVCGYEATVTATMDPV